PRRRRRNPVSAAERRPPALSHAPTSTFPRPGLGESRTRRGSATLAQGADADLEQRQGALAQRAQALGPGAVEDPRRAAHGLAQGAVGGVPPEIAGQARLPGVDLDVDALVETEFRVRAADAGVLDAAP